MTQNFRVSTSGPFPESCSNHVPVSARVVASFSGCGHSAVHYCHMNLLDITSLDLPAATCAKRCTKLKRTIWLHKLASELSLQ